MVSRFGVSLDKDILDDLDNFVKTHQFPNRSQAIRYLIQNAMVEEKWIEDKEVVGAIILVYDHHKKNVVNNLLEIQHDFVGSILSSQHVHLDHNNCMETIILKGKASQLKVLGNRLISLKGIKHGKLVMTAV
ncbi:MAG: nickel-responsive transcriptional regulator NikR [Deltaproteobacteria bacterium]|nr:nickel-responsive transcriptional regulator NikR [Deltaproteobacteria bacterium]